MQKFSMLYRCYLSLDIAPNGASQRFNQAGFERSFQSLWTSEEEVVTEGIKPEKLCR